MLRFSGAADAVTRQFWREHPALGKQDRETIAAGAYTALRHLASFSQRLLLMLGQERAPPRLLALLALAHSRPSLLATLPTADRDFAVRALALPMDSWPLQVRCDWPVWLLDKLCARFDEEALLALAAALNGMASLDVRVNTLKASREQAQQSLAHDGIAAQPCVLSPIGLRIATRHDLRASQAFQQGWIEVQDEGSQLLALLAAPKRNELLVDFCAGAGGKSLAFAALMQGTGRIYALDTHSERLTHLRERAARAGARNIQAIALGGHDDEILSRLAGKADSVFVDAPCTGLGTLRRNPDLKWRQTPQSLAEILVKQRAILWQAARLVRHGGRLFYATCSLLAEENEEQAASFGVAHPDFIPVSAAALHRASALGHDGAAPRWAQDAAYLQLWPHQDGTDGFFIAAWQRQAIKAD